MKNNFKHFMVIINLMTMLLIIVPKVSAMDLSEPQPVVHAVLFYSPSCGHCEKVITQDLPPLIEKYGNRLQIIGINVATVEGQSLYQALIEGWEIPETRLGVPTLVVGDVYMVGSGEIPAKFPGIVEKGMETDGIDWPDIPGLLDIISMADASSKEPSTEDNNQASEVTTDQDSNEVVVNQSADDHADETAEVSSVKQTNVPSGENPSTNTEGDTSTISIPFDDEITIADRFKMDLAGNILAVVTLAGLTISVVWIFIRIFNPAPSVSSDWSWVIPLLSIAGLIVAGYLSFVEVTETEAVCGPIGDCNAVQQSPYAQLFGFLPVGVLGLMGYIAILGSWLLNKYGPSTWREITSLAIWGMALFGVLFSIYLTFLEPFVIGATCAWCISSAIIITIQLWVATEPVRQIWNDSEDESLIDDSIQKTQAESPDLEGQDENQ